MENGDNILGGGPEGGDHMKDPGVDGKIILEYFL
jgi:hypothetical protein